VGTLGVVARGFRDLSVYRSAARLGDEIHGSVALWNSLDQWTTGVQLIRAVDSVGANIAESHGRYQPADQKRFLFIARGSAAEAEHWLDRAKARGLALPNDAEKRMREIARMLNGLIRARARA
jgi:four helix bundle protein